MDPPPTPLTRSGQGHGGVAISPAVQFHQSIVPRARSSEALLIAQFNRFGGF